MSQDIPIELDAAARADALSYKLRKEAFVSNLSGSSLTDINTVTLVAAVRTVSIKFLLLSSPQLIFPEWLSQLSSSGQHYRKEEY